MRVATYNLCEPYGQRNQGGSTTASSAAIDTVWIQNTDNTNTQTLKVKTAQFQFDASFQPYVQGTIICVQPTNAVLATIDPRQARQVRFTMRQTVNGAVTDQQWNLFLVARTLDWSTGELTLTVASYDKLYSEFAFGTVIDQGSTNGDDLLTVLNVNPIPIPGSSFYGGIPSTAAGSTNNPIISKADQVWQPGVTEMDYLQPFLDQANLWLYVDELGNSWTALVGFASDTSTHVLDDATSVANIVDTITRDDPYWANYIVLQYTGQVTTATGAAQISTFGSSTLNYRKVLVVNRPTKRPSGAANPASKLYLAAGKRGQSLSVVAQADITARPNQTWQVSYQGVTHAGPVQSVQLDLGAGTMTLAMSATS